MKRALITGITGQDGSYLAEQLLAKGYEVHGIVRRSSTFNTERIDHLYRDPHERGVRLHLHYGDLNDASSLQSIVAATRPDEIYNLGAQSHVRVSFDIPEYTGEITGLGVTRLLETIRKVGAPCKLYQATSSEVFGGVGDAPQNETTRFHPRSPYAAAKAYAYYVAQNYREAYGMFVCNGILFNHESERRGETFVTRKITRAVGRIKLGLQSELFLGNLEAKRDWGHAEDYVDAMWRMLQQDKADDFVIATGFTHSVRHLVEVAFSHAGLDWQKYVRTDPAFLRPAEVDLLVGDASHAKAALSWEPTVTFEQLIAMMVDADLARYRADQPAPVAIG